MTCILYTVLLIWSILGIYSFSTQGLKAWRYVVYFPVFSAVILARYPLSPIAIWLWSSPDRLYLTHWKWLETIDNTLDGDGGHKTEHMIGSDTLAWYNRVLWLWRNGGNRFNYYVIGVDAANPPGGVFWYQKHVPLPKQRFLDIRLGWDISDPKQGRSKYVFTIRSKTKP